MPDDQGDGMGAFHRGDAVRYRNLYVDLGGKLWYCAKYGGAVGWMSGRCVKMQCAN